MFIAVFALSIVSRYNIYFVHQQFPDSDLSSETDIFKIAINSIYMGFYLMVLGCMAYYFNYDNTWFKGISIIYLTLILAVLIVYKNHVDDQFSQSVSTRHLSRKDLECLSNPIVDQYKVS